VRIDLNPRRKKSPVDVFDELAALVAQGLTEQRDRLLDLVDRVVSAMIEESCPTNRPPEDWDWQSIHEGFFEHFGVKLDKDVDDLGDVEQVVRVVYQRAEAIYFEKEKAYGVEPLMRLFRHFYLQEIDQAWVDHLTNMEHLRDGIGLRGYGQRDPKNEYKKEGYNLFLNMVANVSSSVLTKTFEAEFRRSEEIAEMEAEAEARHQAELAEAVARHVGEDSGGNGSLPPADPAQTLAKMREEAAQAPQREQRAAPKIGRNDPCPCGSGKKFKQCHGSVLEDEDSPSA
jgi:preprotein translocase subunit SecA